MQKEQFLGRVLTGGYILQEVLGDGGFGVTYLAVHENSQSPVAIKLFRESASPQDIIVFAREANTMAKLQHKYIVPFIDLDLMQQKVSLQGGREIDEYYPFIVMAYANYGSLKKYRQKNMPLSPNQAVNFIVQASSAIQFAHDNKVLHRDIKPDNLLLQKRTEQEHLNIWVTDFGIAIQAHTETSLTSQKFGGTPPYVAPEQFFGKAVRESDQYALAIVTFELLTGRRPFTGEDIDQRANESVQLFQWAMIHQNNPLPSFYEALHATGSEKLMNQVLEALEEVVGKALAKKPQDRYDSIEAFSNDLHDRYRKAVEKQEKQIQIFDEKGDQFLSRGQYEEALLAFDEVIRLDPKHSYAFSHKSFALEHLGRYEEALMAQDEAIRLSPNDFLQFLIKGSTLVSLGRYEEALLACDEAIRLSPNNWFSSIIFRSKGANLEKLGKYEEAIKAYEKAVELDPTSQYALQELEQIKKRRQFLF